MLVLVLALGCGSRSELLGAGGLDGVGAFDSGGGPPATVSCIEEGVFEAVSRMNTARVGHAVLRLADGRVMVSGGSGCEPLCDRAEFYDPDLDRWTLSEASFLLRTIHTATLLSDGRVLIVGGAPGPDGAPTLVEIFDPSTGEVEQGPALSDSRFAAAAVRMSTGAVLLAGGYGGTPDEEFGGLPSWIYEPLSSIWRTVPPVSEAALSGSYIGMVAIGDAVVAAVQEGVFLFGQQSETWSMLSAPAPIPDFPIMLDLPEIVAQGERVAVVDQRARFGVGGIDTEFRWTHFSPNFGAGRAKGILPLCDGGMVVGGESYLVFFESLAKRTSELGPYLADAEPVQLLDGSWLIVGGTEAGMDYTPTNRTFRFGASD